MRLCDEYQMCLLLFDIIKQGSEVSTSEQVKIKQLHIEVSEYDDALRVT